MKLAVITDEIDADLEHALDVMAEYDIHAAELRFVGDKNIGDMKPAEVDELRKRLEAKGAYAISVASAVYKNSLPDTGDDSPTGPLHGATALGFEDQIDLLAKCITTAKTLGAPFVRTFAFWKHGSLTPELEDRIVDAYAVPARMAEDAGITLIIENEHACYIGTGAQVARVASRIGSPAVKVVWDPGNAVCAGEAAFPSGYEAVKPWIAHVHVKDAKDTGSGHLEFCVLGDGVVNWPGQLKALKADGYDGYLSLETHYSKQGDKEAASRECLEALVGMFKSMD